MITFTPRSHWLLQQQFCLNLVKFIIIMSCDSLSIFLSALLCESLIIHKHTHLKSVTTHYCNWPILILSQYFFGLYFLNITGSSTWTNVIAHPYLYVKLKYLKEFGFVESLVLIFKVDKIQTVTNEGVANRLVHIMYLLVILKV